MIGSMPFKIFAIFNNKFFHFNSFEKLKEYSVPSQVNSASLHPEQSVFVCGGDDFKMYKFDYENGNEIGNFLIYILMNLKLNL